MPEPTDSRVAVYLDFDNIVISRYQQLYGRGAWQRDGVRDYDKSTPDADKNIAEKIAAATVDIGAILDFAASFGTTVVNRAYADWSVPVNAAYQRQLMNRAVDLTQLFTTTTRGTKNGADIRLAVDVVEDLFRLPDLTHVIIVAGDSDYIALAQKAKRLGRFVVGIGVAGSTSTSLAAACDEFEDYDALPGVERPKPPQPPVAEPVETPAEQQASTEASSDSTSEPTSELPKRRSRRVSVPAFSDAPEPEIEVKDPQVAATEALVRALQIGHAKGDADEWLHSAAIKQQMKRQDPSFNEKALGFRSFSDFIKSRDELVELQEDGQNRLVRLR